LGAIPSSSMISRHCLFNLDRYLEEYIAAAGLGEDRKGPLFPCSSPMCGV